MLAALEQLIGGMGAKGEPCPPAHRGANGWHMEGGPPWHTSEHSSGNFTWKQPDFKPHGAFAGCLRACMGLPAGGEAAGCRSASPQPGPSAGQEGAEEVASEGAIPGACRHQAQP